MFTINRIGRQIGHFRYEVRHNLMPEEIEDTGLLFLPACRAT